MPDDPQISLSFVLAMPPGVNKLYTPSRTKTGARMRKTDAARDWASQAKYAVEMQRAGESIPRLFTAVLYIAESNFDLDAPTKELFDALQHGGAITNDRYNRGYSVWPDAELPAGSVRVDLTSMAGDPPKKMAVKRKNPIA